MTEKDPVLERLTNLTFALLNADRYSRKYLTASWVRTHVAGYEGLSDAAFAKAFSRDRKRLALVGVPIETLAEYESLDGTIQPAYRISTDDYALPEISFTPAEATVLGLAGDMGMSKELAAFARSGWTKIAASGVTRELGGAEITTVGDINSVTPQALETIMQACNRGLRITFNYQPGIDAEAVTRTMDPWGLVPLRSRLYLVGFDVDRGNARCFRISRVSNIACAGKADHRQPAEVNLQEIVEETLRRGHQLVTATLAIQPGKASSLSQLGMPTEAEVLPGYEAVQLIDVDSGWLIREACAHAPHALVVSPADVREDVIAALREVAGLHEEDN
ncbi:WYL domain-containing protein [Staphylococcus chromogenes]|nr:WYL domain-containing protein [Staphylococcus chromogenes]